MTLQIDICRTLKAELNQSSCAKIPRYKLLYEALRKQILDGLLSPGICLPSSRQLADQLNLSRNTAMAALNQLCAEGYAETRPASGVFILPTLPTHWEKSHFKKTIQNSIARLSVRGMKIYDDMPKYPGRSGAFTPGIPDLKLFPFSLWQRYLARHMRNPKLPWQSYPQQGGFSELRTIIAEYLRIFRGIQCSPQQILITNGTQNSLNLITLLLTDEQDSVWIENPGYPGARSAFISAGLKIIGQPLDSEGLAPHRAAWRNSPKLIYVTPSHQYPLGMVMSAARRRQLLLQASENSTFFIEDDYDSEFRFEGAPIAAMQALSPHQVIYLSSFSKTFFPALRIGYMVLPENYIEIFRATQARLHREPSYILQCALAEFIQDGHYSAHIRKMRHEYQHRRDLLVSLFRQHCGDNIQLLGTDTGLHLTTIFPDDVDSVQIEAQAYERGIIARSLTRYYLSGSKIKAKEGLVIGFGEADSEKILKTAKILFQILNPFIN